MVAETPVASVHVRSGALLAGKLVVPRNKAFCVGRRKTVDRRRMILGAEKLSVAKVVLASAMAACLTGCVDPDQSVANHVLMEDGYRNIVLAKRSTFSSVLAGCDRRYRYSTPFEATVTGHRVTGVVCSGDIPSGAPQVRRFD